LRVFSVQSVKICINGDDDYERMCTSTAKNERQF
jgi:hypothetical protein